MKDSPFQQYIQQGLTVSIRLPSPLLRMLLLVLGCVIFTIAGIWMFFAAEGIHNRMVAIVCVLFFGGMGMPVLLPFLTTSNIAIFDRTGLYTRRYGVKILWADVRAVGIVEAQGFESLCVAVENYERYRTKIPWIAVLIRSIYCTLPGRLGAVTLIAALKPGQVRKTWKTLSDTKDFDFLWSHHEFPYMSIREVKKIIEIESSKVRRLS